MKAIWVRWLTLVMLVLACSPLALASVVLPGSLVSVAWLHAHRSDVEVVAIRADAAEFTVAPRHGTRGSDRRQIVAVGGHIPGARLLLDGAIRAPRVIDGRTIRFMLPTAHAFQTVLQNAGIDRGTPLVLVSTGTSAAAMDMATRLYWSLRTYGTRDVAVLNGGLAAWLQAGYSTSVRAARSARGDWRAQAANPQWTADSAAVARATARGIALIDARPTPEFLGIVRNPLVSEAGHIAGARSFPPNAIVRKRGIAAFFMRAAAYRLILPELGIRANAPSITYCNTGHLASGAWFVLHAILHNPHVRLYDGSMLEWTAERRPVVPAGVAAAVAGK